jgi:hypothetical protein
MTRRPIDQHAVRIPQQSGLLPCLYIPIAARDTNAIEKYVGRILAPLAPGSSSKALLVEAHEPDKPDERLAIWGLPEAAVLHYPRQVWVHVDYTAYRRAYIRAFPDVDLTDFVIDHIMNRRVARLKGFTYQIIEYKRSFHLLDGDLDRLTDEVFEELAAIGPKVKLALINQPLPVEHCPSCRTAFSRTLKPPVVSRLTDPAWATESACGIYINPDRPSLSIVLSFREQQILSGSLHLCQCKFLDYSSEGIDERVPVKARPSIRAQATRIVNQVLREWTPSKVFIGTGDPDAPDIISTLTLPKCWEVRRSNQAEQKSVSKAQRDSIPRQST